MTDKSELDALLRADMRLFTQRVFSTLNPGKNFYDNWHIEAICYHLCLCSTGEIRRLIITVPPRCLKSITTSVAFVAWMLGRDPTLRFIVASYASGLSVELSNATRRVMEAPWYRSVFPHTRIDPAKNTESLFQTTQRGSRFATSVGGTLTGIGADFIILDDLLKASDETSEAALNTAIEWQRSSVSTRFDDPARGVKIVIMQRLHENDPVGYLLEHENYVHLNLPAIAEEKHEIRIGPGRSITREVGDLLHPERLSEETLFELKLQLGPYAFAAQYQQNPAPTGGGIVKWEWFGSYDYAPPRDYGDFVVQSWDTASTVKEDASYSVCTTILCHDGLYYILDVYRDRVDFPQLESITRNLAQKWSTNLIIIEETNGSIPLIQTLQRKYREMNVKGCGPKGDKATRMKAETPAIYAGRVLLPKDAPWLAEFKREILKFPMHKYDDQVDSLSQALYWAREFGPNHPQSIGRTASKITFAGKRSRGSTLETLLNLPGY